MRGQHPDSFILMPGEIAYEKFKNRGCDEWSVDDAIKYSMDNEWTWLTDALKKHNRPVFFVECDDEEFWGLTKEYDAILFRNSSESYDHENINGTYVIVNDTSLIIELKKEKELETDKMRMR